MNLSVSPEFLAGWQRLYLAVGRTFTRFGCGRGPATGSVAGVTVRLGRAEWDEINLRLLTRSGGLCEARTSACLAGPDGRLAERRDGRAVRHSRHHRVPRGAGGSALDDQHSLDRLLLVCGDGVSGCHGHIEQFRAEAFARGLLVSQHEADPAAVPLELAGGRLVLLDPRGGFYLPCGWRV